MAILYKLHCNVYFISLSNMMLLLLFTFLVQLSHSLADDPRERHHDSIIQIPSPTLKMFDVTQAPSFEIENKRLYNPVLNSDSDEFIGQARNNIVFHTYEAKVEPDHPTEEPDRAARTESPTVTEKTMTPPWTLATGHQLLMRRDLVLISERKEALRADEGYPKEEPLGGNHTLSPTVAVTSLLREFCTVDQSCPESINMTKFGFDWENHAFPAYNLIDGNTRTVSSVLGSHEAPTWIVLFLSEEVFVGQVKIHLSNLLEETDHEKILEQLLVTLEWFDLKTTCDPVEKGSNDTRLISSCGGQIASKVFLQIDRFKKRYNPINLTLSEIEVIGNPSGFSKLSMKSPRIKFNASIANIYFRGVSSNIAEETRKAVNTVEEHEKLANSPYKIEHILIIGLKSRKLGLLLYKNRRLFLRLYENGTVEIVLEKCGALKPIQRANPDQLPPCLLLDQTTSPCSWTLVFWDSSIEVYIDKSVVGKFEKLPAVDCTADPTKCERCSSIFSLGEAIAYSGNLFDLDVIETSHHLREPKVLSTKAERHDECYFHEQTLISNCMDELTNDQVYMNLTSNRFCFGFEALGVSDILEDEFVNLSLDSVVADIADSIMNNYYEVYFRSDEYLADVEEEFALQLQSLAKLEEVEILKLEEMGRHEMIFAVLRYYQADSVYQNMEGFLHDLQEVLLLRNDSLSLTEVMNMTSEINEKLDNRSSGPTAMNAIFMGSGEIPSASDAVGSGREADELTDLEDMDIEPEQLDLEQMHLEKVDSERELSDEIESTEEPTGEPPTRTVVEEEETFEFDLQLEEFGRQFLSNAHVEISIVDDENVGLQISNRGGPLV